MIPALVNSVLLSRGKSTSIVPGANNFVQPFQPIARRHRLDRSGALVGVERTFPVAPLGDPFFSSVVLLMGFEGTNGATGAPGMTDESSAAHGTGTATNATISTSQFEFGTSSLFRTGVGGLTFPNSADWQLGSGPFTIEMWVRGDSSIGGFPFLVSLWGGAGNTSWTYWVSSTKVSFNVSTDGSNNINQIGGFSTLIANSWTALAIDFDGTKYRSYFNGALDGSSTTLHTFFNSTAVLSIAQTNDYGGYIDELRITKGVARYASDAGYTPATSPFPRS